MTRGSGAGGTPTLRVAAGVGGGPAERLAAAARETSDAVRVVRTGPTGVDALEPLAMASLEGRTAFFPVPTRATVRATVEALADGRLPTDGADAVVAHDPGTETIPTPDDGPLSVGRRAVLGRCGWVDPLDPDAGALLSPDRTAEPVAGVGLLGRGRGDAAADSPVGDAWARTRAADGDPVVVVNANEPRSEQRVARTLLAGDPAAVLDGAAAVAEHVGAADAVLVLNESDAALHRHLADAVAAVADDLPVVPQLVAGPDEYRAGAPTAALEALEGADRVEPRIQPPGPAEHGLYGRPTVIHTPRTVAQVRRALRHPEAFTAGDADPGTRLFTVTGDVVDPATVELPTGGSLAAVRDAVETVGAFKTACVGGVLGGFTRSLDVPPSAPSLDAAGLGTDGVVELLNEGRCAVADAGERARFAAAENSGRCVPGREGTKQLTELLRDVYRGEFDDDGIRELGRVMERSSNCRIGAHAPRPVTTAIDEFEVEFRAHADGRCPAGVCTEDL
ncbi:MAG: NADH-ubiquinone oxidoreductase-F iron-sulfur binding region domain-containing protein [Haloferacaceae archaeon]